MRRRLDAELVRRGLVASRAQAQERIAAGQVRVSGAVADKAARLVGPDEPVLLVEPPRFVGRGGEKLAAALEGFGIDARGRTALDAGASTGGFTDCLLQAGATSVLAVDVGHGQLHPRLRSDPRVRVRERCDIRAHDVEADGGPVELVVADLSFISLTSVLEALLGAARPDADLVLLVKPQFEVGRAEASRSRGVIRDPLLRRGAVERALAAAEAAGAVIMGAMPSPIRGADGNQEVLVHVVAPPTDRRPERPIDLDAVVGA